MQVHLQTQQAISKGVLGMAVQVVKVHGVLALYNGLTASLGRQVCKVPSSGSEGVVI